MSPGSNRRCAAAISSERHRHCGSRLAGGVWEWVPGFGMPHPSDVALQCSVKNGFDIGSSRFCGFFVGFAVIGEKNCFYKENESGKDLKIHGFCAILSKW
ncbi:hypothetical protein SDC9_103160 [bioreactor metagenome]|uniref:Sulfatase-modifying factor enzyme domain-containing protein n=1 Tax=bioreactor metagenome TaxID=1076179 RepID=A0A645AUB6_9ZZZZ